MPPKKKVERGAQENIQVRHAYTCRAAQRTRLQTAFLALKY
jgi:hypothetical protein